MAGAAYYQNLHCVSSLFIRRQSLMSEEAERHFFADVTIC
jgi:hypothetical protein